MADMAAGMNVNSSLSRKASEARTSAGVHPAWLRLMRYCADLGHGEIEKLKIQDGLPVLADVIREKVKFT
jgi:hypothetical protein